jgi:hypothetical protein
LAILCSSALSMAKELNQNALSSTGLSVSLQLRKPEIMLFADLPYCHALLLRTEFLIDYSRHPGRDSLVCSLAGLQILSKLQGRNKQPPHLVKILVYFYSFCGIVIFRCSSFSYSINILVSSSFPVLLYEFLLIGIDFCLPFYVFCLVSSCFWLPILSISLCHFNFFAQYYRFLNIIMFWTSVSQLGVAKLCLRGPWDEKILLFYFLRYIAVNFKLSWSHFYLHVWIKRLWKTTPIANILVGLYCVY